MLRSRWFKSVILLVIIMLAAISPCSALKRVVPETTKEAIVAKYLKGRSLDRVEGIWSFTVNGYFCEVAIFKNPSKEHYPEWHYLGVVVNANSDFGKVGEAKIILRKTAAKEVYTGSYIVQYGSWGAQTPQATNFVMLDKNIMQTRVPSLGLVSFVRTDDAIAGPGSGGSGGGGSGTGFFVTPTVVITNHHVIEDAKRVEITFQNDFTLSARVVAQDASNDVAVLIVEGLESRVKPFLLGRTKGTKEGEKVYTVGFPLSTNLSTRHKISEGMINGLTGIKDDPTVFQISIPIQPGNSGGPLITTDGRIIGITSSGLSSAFYLNKYGVVPENVNFAVKADYIMPLLEIVGAKVEVRERLDRVFGPVALMEMAKDAVVYVRTYRD